MFVKITTIVLMAIIAQNLTASFQFTGDEVWDGYSAKWTENPKDGFYTLPQSLDDAERQGWTEISGTERPHSVKAMGYYGDPRVVILYSKCTGKVLGHQIGVPVADLVNSGVPINYNANSAITKKTLNGEEYYTGTALYRQDKRKNTREIWLEVDGEFVKFPTKPELLTRDTPYYLKKCVTWMGLHYYQINSTTNCSNIFPWVPLRVQDDIIGIVFQIVGASNSTSNNKRRWFESLPISQLAYTIPDAPSCLNEGFANYGAVSIHVWLKKDPVSIICENECTAAYNSTSGRKQSSYQSAKRRRRALGSGNVCPV